VKTFFFLSFSFFSFFFFLLFSATPQRSKFAGMPFRVKQKESGKAKDHNSDENSSSVRLGPEGRSSVFKRTGT
jgi:hypothetical protein